MPAVTNNLDVAMVIAHGLAPRYVQDGRGMEKT